MEIEVIVKGEITERERDLLKGLESYLGGFLFLTHQVTTLDTHSKISEAWEFTWQTPGRED